MEGLQWIPYLFLIICIAGVIGGSTSIINTQFGKSVSACYNSSFTLVTNNSDSRGNYCINSTLAMITPQGTDGLNLSNEYYTIKKSQEGALVIAGQLGTVSIIGMMVVIISLLAGLFAYFRYFNGGQGGGM